jgi:flagellar assembly protein FliH
LPNVFDFELVGGGAIPQDVIDESRASASAVGYALGWSQGLHDARESMATDRQRANDAGRELAEQTAGSARLLLQALAEAVDQLEHAAREARVQDEDAILHAAVDVAEALIGRELTDDNLATRSALARALGLAPAHEAVTVRLNPAVFGALSEDDFQGLLAAVSESSGRSIKFEPDPTLAVGDALASSTATSIDARLGEGLRRVREHLSRTTDAGATAASSARAVRVAS